MGGRSPIAVLHDTVGLVSGVLKGSVRRLQTAASLQNADGTKDVTVIDDVDTPANKRLLVEADIKPGITVNVSQAAAAPLDLVATDLMNGGSSDMNVDGSSTPVVFKVVADATKHIILDEIRITISGPKVFRFDGATFGEGSGTLTNGVLLEGVINNGSTITLATIKRNEGFLRLRSLGAAAFYAANGANEAISVSYIIGGASRLEAGSADEIRVTIRDNLLPGGASKIKHFRATLFGELETP